MLLGIKGLQLRNDFDIVGQGKDCSCKHMFNFVCIPLGGALLNDSEQ